MAIGSVDCAQGLHRKCRKQRSGIRGQGSEVSGQRSVVSLWFRAERRTRPRGATSGAEARRLMWPLTRAYEACSTRFELPASLRLAGQPMRLSPHELGIRCTGVEEFSRGFMGTKLAAGQGERSQSLGAGRRTERSLL